MHTPIFDMLRKIKHENRTRFYMPGHKGGRLLGDEESLFSFDITEIEGADDLHAPEGAILEAERLASRTFGAGHTYFLVGGASAGIHAMLSVYLGDSDTVIMDRASHKSAIYALENCGATAVFLTPEMGEDNIPLGITPDTLKRALKEHPEAKVLYLTSPNYYGVCQDLEALIPIAREAGLKVLVDEAHGAHFAFSSRLPKTAMELGADAVVESAHKTLPALTGSAYLHVREKSREMEEALQRFQTTSPSYLLMASLDYARAYMAEHQEDLEQFIDDCIEIFGQENSPHRDVTRLVFTPRNMTGFKAAEILRREKNIECEMADFDHVVMIPTMGNTREELLSLKEAMDDIMSRPGEKKKIKVTLPKTATLRVRDFSHKRREEIPLREAVGKRCGGMVYLYPPGIPILLPGEVIGEREKDQILHYMEEGLSVRGAINGENILIFPTL